MTKVELYNDNYANWKSYNLPKKAQLVIADIPYQIGNNAYGSDPRWYVDGDNKNGESKLAGSAFFRTDAYFKIPEFFHFCSKLMRKEPKERGKAPAMIIFCAWQQIPMVMREGARYGFKNAYPLYFIKRTSGQVLKSNMKILGAVETAMVLYREKLPKFNNNGEMILNWMKWPVDKGIPKIHPTQKPVALLKRLIEIFTDPGDVVIDPVAGSGSTLRACAETGRTCYGFEVDKGFYQAAMDKMLKNTAIDLFASA